jgi:tetratricopeptide (TPR) repeat protein
MWRLEILLLGLGLMGTALSQTGASAPQEPRNSKQAKPSPAPAHPDRDQEAGESSSRDTRIDLAPPQDDAKNHPNSAAAVSEAETSVEGESDVQEFHPWDPHKALKDIEVGDFYFKKKNYRAALDRYQEALYYKENDAMATFHVAQCQEKLNQPAEALKNYQAYLKVLPHGPLAEEAQKSIERLKGSAPAETGPSAKRQDQPQP